MASHAMLLLLLQTALLVAVVMAWSTDGVPGEEGQALVVETPVAGERPSFVRQQLTGRTRSCRLHKAVCTKTPYPAGWICCGNSCTNVKTDYRNCGACGKKCIWPQTCCGGKCVYLSKDKNNCGRCGLKCPKDGCKYGICQYNN